MLRIWSEISPEAPLEESEKIWKMGTSEFTKSFVCARSKYGDTV
jgi:hypothetical protein